MAVAACLAAAGFWLLAADACKEADHPAPEHQVPHYYLGGYHLRQGRGQDAVTSFGRALEFQPGSVTTLVAMGNALKSLGRLDEAAESYQKALVIQADEPEANTNLGNILLSRGRVREACDHYRAALAGAPDDISLLNNLAWVLATFVDDDVRDGKQAVELAERAWKLADGQYPLILMSLAAAYAEAGRFDDAVATAERCIDLAIRTSNPTLEGTVRVHLGSYQNGIPVRKSLY